MPRSPLSPPGSSQSSSKQSDTKRRKKSWSLEGKKKKDQPKSRQQIKAMLLAKEKIKEEDLDAPPNSDAKDDSLRIVEQHKFMEKEEYAMKQPQIALKRKVKKKGNRRAETVRVVRKNKSRSEVPKGSRESESGSATPTDTTLFKERASANNSNANSPDNSDRQREREVRRRALDLELRRRALVDRTQERTLDRSNRSTTDHSTPLDSEGDSAPLPLAREPEPEIETRRSPVVVQRSTVEKVAGASRMVKLATQQQKDQLDQRRMSNPRTARSTMGLASSATAVKSTAAVKSTGETSTQLALEPEPDLDRVRRQKEAAFMKRFLTALKLLPNTAPPRPITPPPRSEDSPSDSSKRHPRNYKHNMHQMRKHPK